MRFYAHGAPKSRTRGSMSTATKAVQRIVNSCSYQGHDWQPTIILGYFLCQRCKALAACTTCVPAPRGNPKSGLCGKHSHLRTSDHQQEVLSHVKAERTARSTHNLSNQKSTQSRCIY